MSEFRCLRKEQVLQGMNGLVVDMNVVSEIMQTEKMIYSNLKAMGVR